MATNRNVQQWFKKSAENLRLAKLIINFEEKFYDHVCFNASKQMNLLNLRYAFDIPKNLEIH